MMNIFGEKMLTEAEIRLKLSEAIGVAGGLTPWCRANGVNYAYAHKALNGRQVIGPAIARALGYRKVVRFTLGVSHAPAE